MTEGDGLLRVGRKWQYISAKQTEERQARALAEEGSWWVKYRAVLSADTCFICSAPGRLEVAGSAISQRRVKRGCRARLRPWKPGGDGTRSPPVVVSC